MVSRENRISIYEAFMEGLCDKCVSYEDDVKAPFTTHCKSTLGRTQVNLDRSKENVYLCTKKLRRVYER
jgi:hypothetical protein